MSFLTVLKFIKTHFTKQQDPDVERQCPLTDFTLWHCVLQARHWDSRVLFLSLLMTVGAPTPVSQWSLSLWQPGFWEKYVKQDLPVNPGDLGGS